MFVLSCKLTMFFTFNIIYALTIWWRIYNVRRRCLQSAIFIDLLQSRFGEYITHNRTKWYYIYNAFHIKQVPTRSMISTAWFHRQYIRIRFDNLFNCGNYMRKLSIINVRVAGNIHEKAIQYLDILHSYNFVIFRKFGTDG